MKTNILVVVVALAVGMFVMQSAVYGADLIASDSSSGTMPVTYSGNGPDSFASEADQTQGSQQPLQPRTAYIDPQTCDIFAADDPSLPANPGDSMIILDPNGNIGLQFPSSINWPGGYVVAPPNGYNPQENGPWVEIGNGDITFPLGGNVGASFDPAGNVENPDNPNDVPANFKPGTVVTQGGPSLTEAQKAERISALKAEKKKLEEEIAALTAEIAALTEQVEKDQTKKAEKEAKLPAAKSLAKSTEDAADRAQTELQTFLAENQDKEGWSFEQWRWYNNKKSKLEQQLAETRFAALKARNDLENLKSYIEYLKSTIGLEIAWIVDKDRKIYEKNTRISEINFEIASLQ